MKLSRTQKLFGGGLLAVAALTAAGGIFAYTTLIPHDAPEAVSLSQAVQSAAGTRTASTTTPDTSAGGAAGGSASAGNRQASDLTGAWTVITGGNSFVGYRVKEELASIGTFTAVGRTSTITGALQYDGKAITDVQIEADLSSLKSDSAMRDSTLRMQALETGKYPKATFNLTQPIALSEPPAEGAPIKATAVGDLTIHGVTRSVSLDLEGQLTNGLVIVVGSTTIKFADYNIAQPRSAAVLSVEDQGVLELQLVFQKGATRG